MSGLEFCEAAAPCVFAHQRLLVGTAEGGREEFVGSRELVSARNSFSDTLGKRMVKTRAKSARAWAGYESL